MGLHRDRKIEIARQTKTPMLCFLRDVLQLTVRKTQKVVVTPSPGLLQGSDLIMDMESSIKNHHKKAKI